MKREKDLSEQQLRTDCDCFTRSFLRVAYWSRIEHVKTFLRSWFHWALAWFQLKKLEYELRDSKKFQRECEKLRCFILADLEKNYRKQIQDKIGYLKRGV